MVAVLLAAATLIPAGRARAEETPAEAFFGRVSELPNALLTELKDALRKARGAGVEIARVRYTGYPSVQLSQDGSTRRIDMHVLSQRAVVPLAVSRDTAVGLALSYESTTFIDERPVSSVAVPRVHDARGQLGLAAKVSRDWRFTGGVEVGVRSDLSGALSIDDFDVGSTFMFDVAIEPWISLSFGGVSSSTLGVPAPVPALRIKIERSGFLVRSTLPVSIDVSYSPIRVVELGVRAGLSGGSYHLAGADEMLTLRQFLVGPFVRAEVVRGLDLEVAGGLTPWRQLRVGPDDGSPKVLDPPVGPFVRVETSFRL